jgi:hypothetical protein
MSVPAATDPAVIGIGPGGLPIMQTCAKCGKKGHNSRTCGREETPHATPASDASSSKKHRRTQKAALATPRRPRNTTPLLAIEEAIESTRAELAALESAAEILRRRG